MHRFINKEALKNVRLCKMQFSTQNIKEKYTKKIFLIFNLFLIFLRFLSIISVVVLFSSYVLFFVLQSAMNNTYIKVKIVKIMIIQLQENIISLFLIEKNNIFVCVLYFKYNGTTQFNIWHNYKKSVKIVMSYLLITIV